MSVKEYRLEMRLPYDIRKGREREATKGLNLPAIKKKRPRRERHNNEEFTQTA